jgi:hypothetical protein
MAYSFEIGPIRPPNESHSLLIRVTRNCPWNKCKFCNSYKGKTFALRTVEEIRNDILTAKVMRDKIAEISFRSGATGGVQKIIGMVLHDPPNESFRSVALWMLGGAEEVFLQDANALMMKSVDLSNVIVFLKSTFPKVKRVTAYGQSSTAMKKKPAELLMLREAGLSRLHLGLETGYDPLLQYMNKGVTSAELVKGGANVVKSGISLCEYIILGLGGKEMSQQHAVSTARVLNEINPAFIRVKTLTVNSRMPLYEDVRLGRFIRATDEEIVREERTIIENLKCNSYLVSDHISNLLQEVEGQLPVDKPRMLAVIDRFNTLSPDAKTNFIVGRRVGIYSILDDMNDWQKHEVAEQIKLKLAKGEKKLDPRTIFSLMEEFV